MGKVAILFAAFGALTGCAFEIIPLPSGPVGFLAGVVLFSGIFYLAYRLVPIAFKVPPAEFPGGKRKILETGFWTFSVMWLILWIMAHTIQLG